MLRLKLQYFGHLLWRADSLEKTDAGRDWKQEEKGTTEDEMAGRHHRLDAHEFGWTPGVGEESHFLQPKRDFLCNCNICLMYPCSLFLNLCFRYNLATHQQSHSRTWHHVQFWESLWRYCVFIKGNISVEQIIFLHYSWPLTLRKWNKSWPLVLLKVDSDEWLHRQIPRAPVLCCLELASFPDSFPFTAFRSPVKGISISTEHLNCLLPSGMEPL